MKKKNKKKPIRKQPVNQSIKFGSIKKISIPTEIEIQAASPVSPCLTTSSEGTGYCGGCGCC